MKYEFKHEPGTPMWRVVIDGKPDQSFTSLYAAKCWVEHRQKLDLSPNEKILAQIRELQRRRR